MGESLVAFIRRRQIHDGLPITLETVQWMKAMRKAAVLLKLDFQKAYNMIRWEFIDHTMERMSFGDIWRKWMKGCITTVSMSILVNGSPTKPFYLPKRTWQRDPLSLFCFVLVVEIFKKGLVESLCVGKEKVELHIYDLRMTLNYFVWQMK